jgi:hypothetical protein
MHKKAEETKKLADVITIKKKDNIPISAMATQAPRPSVPRSTKGMTNVITSESTHATKGMTKRKGN